MNTSTAKITYRGYVPYGWIAVKFCRIEFSGNDSDIHTRNYHEIEFSELRKYQPTFEQIESQIHVLQKVITDKKRWYHIKKLPEEKEIEELKSKLKVTSDKRFKFHTLLYVEFKNYLKKSGFQQESGYVTGDKCKVENEIYTKRS